MSREHYDKTVSQPFSCESNTLAIAVAERRGLLSFNGSPLRTAKCAAF
ncbi:hypothetical protein [Azoarcus sp. DN11]|nr:hypothetical protein [Azoarcus sp. DN11]